MFKPKLWSAFCLLTVVAVVLQARGTRSHRMLFLAPIGTKSHKIFYMGIINALADRGHQITMVTPYESKKLSKNVSEVVVPEADVTHLLPNPFEGNYMMAPLKVVRKTLTLCSDVLENPKVQQLLKEEYDLIFLSAFFSDCFLLAVHRLNVPFIYVSPLGLIASQADMAANPVFPSFVASPIVSFQHPMTFGQRIINTIADSISSEIFKFAMSTIQDWECRRRHICPDDMPYISELRLNSSLVILNSVKTTEVPPRPYTSTVIHAGGIHCRPAKPLPQELNEWAEASGEDGFIFFSLGSAITPSYLPEQYRKVLVRVFGSLKQRVLWKWEQETMDDLPPNVRLGKWLPQQDILSHPRLRLFMTHGGLLSTLESAYHATPVLGLPVFGDQHTNMNEVKRQGWGDVLFWEDLNEDTLKEKILKIINDQSMQKEVHKRSRVMQDQPMSPTYEASYWVEYVIRHKGARHLRCPAFDMPWYKLYNVDVWATVIVVTLLCSYLSLRLLLCCCRTCFTTKRKKD